MKVVLGQYDLCDADAQTVRFSIDKLIVHPRYDNTTEFADLMLVRLNMRVTFNRFIRPICLPQIGNMFLLLLLFINQMKNNESRCCGCVY